MAWHSSPYSGGGPRMSPPHTVPTSVVTRHHGNGPVEAHLAQSRFLNENQSTPRLGPHSQYRHYGHHRPVTNPRNLYGGHHSSPPHPSSGLYDRYFDYTIYPLVPSHHYSHSQNHTERSPRGTSRGSPSRDSYTFGSPPPVDSFRTGGCTCKKSRCLKLYCQCFALSTTCGPKCKCQTCFNTTLHADAIADARKTILERNPSAFDDKFRGGLVTPSPYRAQPPPAPLYLHQSPPVSAWPASAYSTPSAMPPPPFTSTSSGPRPSLRVNKFGCKCRRSFCLKKYCECYQNSVKCGLNCRCTNCRNYPSADSGLPPPGPNPSAMPVRYGSASRRCVSNDSMPMNEPESTQVANSSAEQVEDEDRMAIMAAVAMTQLFGSNKETRDNAAGEGDEKSNQNSQTAGFLPAKTQDLNTNKRAHGAAIVSSPEKSEDEESISACKRARNDDSVETEARTPGYLNTPESRNPSPVSVANPQNANHGQFVHRAPHFHSSLHQIGHRMPYHVPPTQPRSCRFRAYHPYFASAPQHRASSYEDVIKSSGLPKALSFRKICSKCGKTRGEHGELGFGNKCVFQDCGKCGAGVQIHTKAGSPMGILCRLTVEEGATPGAATTYERKIRDLAERAELQKTLMEDKKERVERLAAQKPFLSKTKPQPSRI